MFQVVKSFFMLLNKNSINKFQQFLFQYFWLILQMCIYVQMYFTMISLSIYFHFLFHINL